MGLRTREPRAQRRPVPRLAAPSGGARPRLWIAAAAAACWAGLFSPSSFEARSFVSAPAHFRRRVAPAARTRRRFFEKVVTGTLEKFTPDYWRKENFVCEALDSYLPPAKKGALLTAMEIEPTDPKYWAYLKPLERGWYIEEFLAVGELDQVDQRSMFDAAKGIGAACKLRSWGTASMAFPDIKKDSIDIALISDGGIKRLGSRLENAFRNARKVLTPQGRFFFVVNQEDEEILGGAMEKDFSGASPMDKYGFDIQTSKREMGLTVGYMKKRTGASPRASASPKLPRAQMSGAGGFSKPSPKTRSQKRPPRPY